MSTVVQSASNPISTESIRNQFPALERRHNDHPVAYFDGAGGTQTPRVVVDAVADYLLNHNANTHWEYPTSHETDAIIESARHAFADFLDASANEIVFGPNTTTMIYHLSRALGRTLFPGDEIVITELGTVNNYRGAVELAHSVGALALVDAVHYAPYFLCDVKETNCDFLTCSAYKFYGPHVSVFYGKKDLLEAVDFPKLQPAPDTAPERVEMGTQNHEGIAGAAAAVDFYASLAGQKTAHVSERVRTGSGPGSLRGQPAWGGGSDRVKDSTSSRRANLQSAFKGLRAHSGPQVTRLWESLSGINGVRLYGPPPDVERTPTVSFIVKNVASTEVARRLAEQGLFASHGDFYAATVIERLGLQPEGLVRVGCACYTSDDEIERLIEAVHRIAVGS